MTDDVIQGPGIVAGQADMSLSNILSRTVEDSGGIAFGVPVKQGSAEDGVIAGIAAGTFQGITVARFGADGAAQRSSVGVLVKGAIWLTASGDIAAGDRVMTDGAIWKADGVGSAAYFTLDGGVAETTAGDGELFKLRLWNTSVTQQRVA